MASTVPSQNFGGSAVQEKNHRVSNLISGVGLESRQEQFVAYTTAINPDAGTQPTFAENNPQQPVTHHCRSGNVRLLNGNIEVRREVEAPDSLGNIDVDGYYFQAGDKLLGPRQSLLDYKDGAVGVGSDVRIIVGAPSTGGGAADQTLIADVDGADTVNEANVEFNFNLIANKLNDVITALQTHGLIA